MDPRKSFLSIKQQETERCLLCDKEILQNDNTSCLTTDGWSSFIKNAKEWNSLNIPPDDKFHNFIFVYDAVRGKTTPFGKRHVQCRVDFGSKIKRYTEKYGVIECLSEDVSGPNQDSSSVNKRRVTRSSSEHAKSFEKLCSICQEQRITDSNPYNHGGLGRCESNISSGRVTKVMDTYLSTENSFFSNFGFRSTYTFQPR